MHRREEVWKLKTSRNLFEPVYKAKHEKASTEVKIAFTSLDQLYARVKTILDSKGIIHAQRGLYRSYAQELWKLRKKYSGKTFQAEAYAVGVKYFLMGCELNILREIGILLGFTTFDGLVMLMTNVITDQLKQALEEASTLRSPKVAQNPTETEIQYDEYGRMVKMIITDLVTGEKKVKELIYDAIGNLVKIVESKE